MIHIVRVEGHADNPGDLHKEIEAAIDTLWEIGRFEGSIPSSMAIKGEVYPRLKPGETQNIGGAEYGFEFDGRKVVEFSYLTDRDHPLEPRLQRDIEGNPDFVVYRRLPNGDQVEVTDAVMVIRRKNTAPLEWPGPDDESQPDPFKRSREQLKTLRKADRQWWESPPTMRPTDYNVNSPASFGAFTFGNPASSNS